MSRLASLSFLVITSVFSLACSSAASGPVESGATCPKNSALTYSNFAKDFFDTYCVDCHSSELSGKDRRGAPLKHDFDTLAGVLEVPVEHIDENAAAGPNGVNDFMPESGSKPSLEEREKLGEWLACGRP